MYQRFCAADDHVCWGNLVSGDRARAIAIVTLAEDISNGQYQCIVRTNKDLSVGDFATVHPLRTQPDQVVATSMPADLVPFDCEEFAWRLKYGRYVSGGRNELTLEQIWKHRLMWIRQAAKCTIPRLSLYIGFQQSGTDCIVRALLQCVVNPRDRPAGAVDNIACRVIRVRGSGIDREVWDEVRNGTTCVNPVFRASGRRVSVDVGYNCEADSQREADLHRDADLNGTRSRRILAQSTDVYGNIFPELMRPHRTGNGRL